jgi:protein TonB
MVLAAPAVTPPADAPDRLATVAPGGHAFDVTQVDARPRVETSVAPRVADHTGESAVKEVVILRVLVSPAGRPADVQVLRPSKVDSTVDAAAIAAVRRWRFAPARRRGEAVSCWLSVGVPVAAERHGGSP